MPYNFRKSLLGPLCIQEQEFDTVNSNDELIFSKFTSCIGVIAKSGGTLTGVHLVLWGVDKFSNSTDSFPFNRQAAAQVIRQLPRVPDEICLIGHITVWNDPKQAGAEQNHGFLNLIGQLNQLARVQAFPKGDGIFGAKIVGNRIEITG
jgi:hypothetical protein